MILGPGIALDSFAQKSPEFVPGRYIVVVQEGVDAQQLASDHNLAPVHVYTLALNGFAVAGISVGKANDLAADPRVDFVEQDRIVRAIAQTLPTGVDRIEGDNNSIAKIDGSDERVDIDIAIIDTGIDQDHPDLNVFTGRNFAKGPSWKWDDGNGHGTHVAGIAAALDNDIGVVGMAPGARLWAVKVLGDDGSGFLSDVIAGVDWVTQNADKIEVANMSLGAKGKSDSFRSAIQNSVNAGVVYVVAAGNDSNDVYGDDGKFGTSDDFIPAAYPEVAAISALSDTDGKPGGNGPLSSWGGKDRNGDGVDDGKDDTFAWFSNFSVSVVSNNPVSSTGAAIDLLLPGVDIYSTYKDGTYATLSGTSMASPHGAGLAALYIASQGTRDVNSDGKVDASDVYMIRQVLIDGGVTQDSSNGLATLNDPDNNWEHIGWAATTLGNIPSVTWVNPLDGDTVSGTVTIQIDASDTEDSTGTLTVDWRVDGGTWQAATFNSNTGYYEDSWDSTGVTDGSHKLDARATDSDGNSATATITVKTENTDDPPTVAWVNPKDGDTVKDVITVQIDASDDRDSAGTLTVKWSVDGGTLQDTTYNDSTGYYEAGWDTTSVADGEHILDAIATDSAGNSNTASITVQVNNAGGSGTDMYVWDISFNEKHFGPGGSYTDLITTVNIKQDSDGDGIAESGDDNVSKAKVTMLLTHDTDGDGVFEPGTDDNSWSFSGETNSEGKVTFTLKFASNGDYKAEVTNVTHDTLTYNSSLDADNPDFYTVNNTNSFSPNRRN